MAHTLHSLGGGEEMSWKELLKDEDTSLVEKLVGLKLKEYPGGEEFIFHFMRIHINHPNFLKDYGKTTEYFADQIDKAVFELFPNIDKARRLVRETMHDLQGKLSDLGIGSVFDKGSLIPEFLPVKSVEYQHYEMFMGFVKHEVELVKKSMVKIKK